MLKLVCGLFDVNTALLFAVFVAAAYLYSTWTYSHWSDLGVYCPGNPVPLFGHTMSAVLGRIPHITLWQDLYNELGDRPFGGIYSVRTPQLIVKDPELVGRILVKDFDHFMDRGMYEKVHSNPLNKNIFFTGGNRWKTMRQKLTPSFTANKLKYMNAQVKECSDNLLANIDKEVIDKSTKPMEIREMMAKYSTDVIGSCAFGLKLDAINDPDSEFRKHGKTVFQPSLRAKIIMMLMLMQPSLFRILRVNNFSHRTIEFFREAFQQTIKHRIKHNEDRKDIVQQLMKAREDLVLNPNLKPEEKFTEMEIVANAYIFFVAGFETVSTSMSFCLYELALRRDIQERVRKEILEAKAKFKGQMNNEYLHELPYLSMVIKETLRKYPPLVTLNREVTKPYVLPGTNIKLKNGTKIVVLAHSLHYDPKYYKDPNTFDPERFSQENSFNLIPNTYMPFGDGPRFCIGKRFAEFEMKMALSDVLSNYEVMTCDKTQIPVKFAIGSFVNIPESIWLKFRKI